MTIQYRREIDGLRAVAVSSVILFHAGFTRISGGFVGVDVFFVISGYLITSLILAELKTGSFSLLAFYERRARRILPALICVVLASIPFACWWLTPSDLTNFSKSIVAVSGFVSNLYFLGERGYFDPVAELKPLLHTWSLAVEEQFYLLFPPLVMLLWRFGQHRLVWILSGSALASLVFAQWAATNAPDLAFFILPTRAWELLIGAILAVRLADREMPPAAALLHQALSGLGLVLIVFAVLTFDKDTPVPGIQFLIPTLGTALIIAFALPGTAASSILGSRPFVGIGLISYSAYLWHWPLFTFARYRSPTEPATALFILLIAATFLLAYLSWRFVEQPFRNRTRFSRAQIFKLAGAGTAAILAIGLVGDLYEGLPQRFPPDIVANKRYSICRVNNNRLPENPDIKYCEFGDLSATRTLVVFGDSHVRALSREIDRQLKAQKIRGLLVDLDDHCQIIPQFYLEDGLGEQARCRKVFQDLVDYSRKTSFGIVIAMRWTMRLYPTEGEIDDLAFTAGDGAIGRVPYRKYLALSPEGKVSIAASDKRAGLRQFIDGFLSTGVKVYMVYPVPELGRDLEKVNLWHYVSTGEVLDQLSIDMRDYDKRNKFAISVLSEFEQRPNFVAIKPRSTFCNTFIKDRCAAQFAGVPYYTDDNHLSDAGSRYVVDTIFSDLK